MALELGSFTPLCENNGIADDCTLYLTFQRYQEYGGDLEQSAFNNYEFKAEGIINRYTFNRLTTEAIIPEAVGRVVYQLISAMKAQDSALSLDGVITSRSNDGVSESRTGMSPDSIYNAISSQMGDIVLQGLSGVRNSKGHRLLYRGFYPDEYIS